MGRLPGAPVGGRGGGRAGAAAEGPEEEAAAEGPEEEPTCVVMRTRRASIHAAMLNGTVAQS